MDVSFKITYFWEKRSDPFHFEEQDYVDVTMLFLCLQRFLALFKGEFVARVGDLDLHFDLDPDLSTIFEELPETLESLASVTDSPVELRFFEQGTDVTFWLERLADTINVRFTTGPSVGGRFINLPKSAFQVPANAFLNEWVRFAQATLDALVDLQPDLADDESYKEYRGRLLALDSMSSPAIISEQEG